MQKAMKQHLVAHWYVYGFNLLFLVVIILPFYWTVISSLKQETDIVTVPPNFIPNPFTFEHYLKLLANPDIQIMIWNSFVVALGTVVLVCICSAMAAFPIARMRFPARKSLFILIIMAMLLPFQALIVPLFLEMRFFQLLNSYWALILISTTFQLPLGLLIMRNAFAAIPKEIQECAYIDGCNPLQVFIKVMLPNVKIGLATVAIFTSSAVWNDFLPALIFMTTKDMYTLPVGLTMQYQPPFYIYWGPVMALSVITFIPTLILFIYTRRFFLSGVTAGALSAE